MRCLDLENGRPISVLIAAMLAIEPAPKIAIYASPSGTELIVERTSIISAPLPAIPWTMPTARDL